MSPSVSTTSAPTVDQLRFAALEKQVELLVLQLQLLSHNSGSSIQLSLKEGGLELGKLNQLPNYPSVSLPTPPEIEISRPTTPESSEDSLSTVSSSQKAEFSLPVTPKPEFSLPVTPALQPEPEEDQYQTPSTKLALQILNIIQRYGQNSNSQGIPWAGKAKFLPFVEEYVINEKPIRCVLPAFPFKSPNRKDKVIGVMPDLGEELALMHLNGLCESIAEIYQPGAMVTITSDGLVYNDLMMIDDAEVWDYSTAVRDIIVAKGLIHVTTLRIVDLLGGSTSKDLTKEEYLKNASSYRDELVEKYGPKNFDSREAVRNDKDTCMTYRGYIKFLTKDLRHGRFAKENPSKRQFKDAIEALALKMIARGKAFATAIEDRCRGFVRLSIHPSVGQTKLSVPLIPQAKDVPIMTPWHSSIAVALDGSFKTVHADEVRDSHDLILRNGQPYYWREKADFYDYGDLKVSFEYLYPCGVIIRPIQGTTPSLRDVDMKKIRKLAELQSPVILRGFANTTERELFVSKAEELGEILPWTFGILQEVKDSGRTDKLGNNVVSNEAMPMHFDGMFKYLPLKDENGNEVKDEQGNVVKVQSPPRFQYFTSIATAPKGTGYTLFAASRLFFKYLPAPWTVDRLEKIKWAMDNNGFWDAKIKDIPLVVRHPVHNTPSMRWHQPWDATKTKFSTCEVTIQNDDQSLVEVVDQLLYDRRICLRFTWEQGDILVSDNVAMLHTRTAFTGDSDRELWRIHFD